MMRTLRSEASKALDTQLAVYNQMSSKYGKDYMGAFVESLTEKNGALPLTSNRAIKAERAEEFGRTMANEMAVTLGHAPTYYVTDDMMELTLLAGESIPSLTVNTADLPTDSGFVLLPAPVLMADKQHMVMATRAFTWWAQRIRIDEVDETVLMYALFTTKADWKVDDYSRQWHDEQPEQWAQVPTWTVLHWMWLPLDNPDDDTVHARALQDEFNEGRAGLSNFYAFMKAFFLLVKQKVAVIEPHQPDRGTRRRWAHAALPPEYGEMQIVMLRKARPPLDSEIIERDPQHFEYSHRFPVSGHWRNQYHPSTDSHEPTWIAEYIKGPEHKPLILKDKVFVWKR